MFPSRKSENLCKQKTAARFVTPGGTWLRWEWAVWQSPDISAASARHLMVKKERKERK